MTPGTREAPLAIVSVSGGKDSTATALCAIERYGKERVQLVHADTGHEHELTESYIRETLPNAIDLPIQIFRQDFTVAMERKRQYVNEVWRKQQVSPEIIEGALAVLICTGIPFLDLCLVAGRFPSAQGQFCTQELKRYPLNAHMFSLMEQELFVESWQGVRRDESQSRADALARERVAEGWWVVRPIVDWTAQQTVDYVLSKGVPLNPLYAQGCSRVGCMPCIYASKDELANISRRWPAHIERLRTWEKLVSAACKNAYTTFFHGDDDLKGLTHKEIYERMNIDARVAWAMTVRGAGAADLFKRHAPVTCSSSYGLCE